MNKSDIIKALECCASTRTCAACPIFGNSECVRKLLSAAKAELEKSEGNDMPKGCTDFDNEREQLIAEREKLVAEIDYQRRQLDEVLQENKLLQAQMHIVHMIFGRRHGTNE